MTAGGTGTAARRKTTLRQEFVSLLAMILNAMSAAALLAGLAGVSWLFLLFLPLYPLMRFTVTLVHELGHAFAASLVRWRVAVIAARPLALHTPTWKMVVSWNITTRDIGGYVFAAPSAPAVNRSNRYLLIIVAGSLANLAACLLAIWLSAALITTPTYSGYPDHAPNSSYSSPDTIRLWLGISLSFALMNMSAIVRSAIPTSKGSWFYNDARLAADLMGSKSRSPQPTASWVAGLLEQNVRPRDIPDWMYATARQENSKAISLPPTHDRWDIMFALDAVQVEPTRVRALIETYRVARGDSDWLLNCDAWLAATHENNIGSAEAALALRRGSDDDTDKAMQAAAEAVVAARHGQIDVVEKKLSWLDQELAARSPLPNAMFDDIRKTIRAIASSTSRQQPSATPA